MTSKPLPPDNDNALEESFITILASDVLASMERYEAEESDQNRRDLVRTVFAALEGMAWIYREHVIEAAKFLESFQVDEAAALSEKSYSVDKEGKIHSQPRFIPLLAMFRLTTRIVLRLNPKLVITFDGEGWQAMRHVSAIRNRITHPKRKCDLELTSSDAARCLTGFFWMLEAITDAMEASNETMATFNRRFRELVDELKRGDPETVRVYNILKDQLD